MSNNQGLIQQATKNNQSVQKAGNPLRWGLHKADGGEIAKALPTVITPERFTRMVLTALSTDKKLELCTPHVFPGSNDDSCPAWPLEPNKPLGQAYLIPYKNKGVLECQFQIGYKGRIDLAYRSGRSRDYTGTSGIKNDEFDYEPAWSEIGSNRPAKDNTGGKPNLLLQSSRTKSGGYGFEVMSIHGDIKVRYAKKYNQSYSSEYSLHKNLRDGKKTA